MDSVQAVKTAFHGARTMFAGTVAGMTGDLAVAVPPGSCHSIIEQMVHVFACEDHTVGAFLTGGTSTWVRDNWDVKLGIPFLAELPAERIVKASWDLDHVFAYGRAVGAQTDAYLSRLTPEELEREVDLGDWGGTMSVGELLLNLQAGHIHQHTGEISALKGMRGAKGYAI